MSVCLLECRERGVDSSGKARRFDWVLKQQALLVNKVRTATGAER